MYDVIIAGAGPVGLFLACELRLAKLSVLVLEQLADPHAPMKRGERVEYIASAAKDNLGVSALLVRPDGFVAWASDTIADPEQVQRAAARWFTTRAAAI